MCLLVSQLYFQIEYQEVHQDSIVSNDHFKQCKKGQMLYVPYDLLSSKGMLGELLSVFQSGVVHFE